MPILQSIQYILYGRYARRIRTNFPKLQPEPQVQGPGELFCYNVIKRSLIGGEGGFFNNSNNFIINGGNFSNVTNLTPAQVDRITDRIIQGESGI